MDGNKDEALRCLRMAEEAIAAGQKERALKFLKIAQRLNHGLQVDELLAVCENLSSGSPAFCTDDGDGDGDGEIKNETGPVKSFQGVEEELGYTEEHVQLIRQINSNKDYYKILGLEKSCSVEEIKRAYKKLSLKVHPDKNKAPGSEEAFKKVCRAFKCLSDVGSRTQYDCAGLAEGHENHESHNVRQRRRRTVDDSFADDFDPDEIFRAFFGEEDMFRTSPVYRRRRRRDRKSQEKIYFHGGHLNLMILIILFPFLMVFLLSYLLPYLDTEYSLLENYSHGISMTTEKYGVQYYVRSSSFDAKYPPGSPSRADIEDSVIKDYKNLLWRNCHIERRRRHRIKDFPTPHCNKLRAMD